MFNNSPFVFQTLENEENNYQKEVNNNNLDDFIINQDVDHDQNKMDIDLEVKSNHDNDDNSIIIHDEVENNHE